MGSLLLSVAVRTIMMKFIILACVAALAAAEADADAYYGGFGYPYAYGYVPFGSSSGLDPITQGLDPVTQGYVPYYGYGYHGYYGKRSADDQADPAHGPVAYGAYPYDLSSVPFGSSSVPFGSSFVPFGYQDFPFAPVRTPVTQGHFGKRSADADAAVVYAGYGYPYAHAYVPFGSSSGLDPITQGLDAATQGYVPYYGYGHYVYGK